MKMNLSHSVVLLAMAFCFLLAALPGFAQSTTSELGTTITFDGKSSKGLFSEFASNSNCELYGYVRHSQTPVQLVSSNVKDESGNVSYIDTKTGLFTNFSNNILYTIGDYLVLGTNNKYNPNYFAVVAPKGYRIIRLTIDVDAESC